MDHEGGSRDNRHDTNDKGGLTRFGISQFWKDKIDIENCTKEEAKDFYIRYFFSRIETGNQGIDLFLFDSLVQHDKDACIWLQKALGFKGRTLDGIIGSKTRATVNTLISSGIGKQAELIQSVASFRMEHYMDIDDNYASRYHKGWSRRFVDVLVASLQEAQPF